MNARKNIKCCEFGKLVYMEISSVLNKENTSKGMSVHLF